MKRVFFALALLLPTQLLAQEVEVKSKVDKVVLFQANAEITRVGKANLPVGRTKLVFAGIPQNLNVDSLRVGGSGAASFSIAGVEQKTRHLTQDVSKAAADLQKKIDLMEREIRGLDLQATRLQTQKNLLQAVQLDKPTPTDQKEVLRSRTSLEMSQVLAFLSESNAKIDTELKLSQEKKEDLNTELQKMKEELSEVQTGGKEESVVEVSVNVDKPGESNLTLTYQMNGARWNPTYNFHFASTTKEPSFSLETYAVASQNTGEDWDNVELTFSTAQSHIGLNRPTIAAKILDIFRPAPVVALGGALRAKASNLAAAPQSAEMMDERLRRDDLKEDKSLDLMEKAKEEVAEVSSLGVVTYKVPARLSVKSDGSVEKVKLTEAALKGQVRNIAIPTRSTFVYREAKLENTMDVPLLPGQVAVFSNGNFVGKQFVPFTPQNKELLLAVGVSDEISVNRKQNKKFEDDSGVVRSFRRIKTGYEIEIENHGLQDAEVVLLEPAPVSRNEQIKVSMDEVSPAALETKDEKRVQKEDGILEWHFTMPTKKKQKVTYLSSVEFASDINVAGIEGL